MKTEFSNHPGAVNNQTNLYRAICKEVYDGDTYTMMVDLGFFTYKSVRIRLRDIDTPEIRGVSEEIKETGFAARDRVVDLILDKPCLIRTYKDKKSFDRWIANVSYYSDQYESWMDLGRTLIQGGLAIDISK